jgi:hypothetical protein
MRGTKLRLTNFIKDVRRREKIFSALSEPEVVTRLISLGLVYNIMEFDKFILYLDKMIKKGRARLIRSNGKYLIKLRRVKWINIL